MEKMTISTINDFENVKGGKCFVRAVGTNVSYVSDIQRLDDSLLKNMNSGGGYYHRQNALAKMQKIEDTEFYTKCYEDWVNSGRKEILTRSVMKHRALAGKLSQACCTLEALYKQENKQATDSILKSFMVKQLFWFDSIFVDERFCYEDKQEMKLVASNIVKKQEYLFFYLVHLIGCDVLLLQAKEDINPEEDKLALSAELVLGDFSPIEIPEYRWRETGSVQNSGISSTLNSNGRITVKLPERNRPSKHPAQNSQRAGMQQTGQNSTVAGAGRSAQTGTSTSDSNNRQNPRVVIPPRPGSRPQPAPQRPAAAPGNTGRSVSITTPSRSVTPVSGATEAEKSFEELAQLASSVVLITVYDEKGEHLGSGSGIMIGKEGYILTNNHVAAGGRSFSVRIEDDEKEYKTDEIIKYHSILDLAIIRIPRKLNPIPVYKGKNPLVRGQKVVAIGSPLGLFNSVSDGIISGFRKIDNVDMIQFTAPTSRGSSGGAVLNMQGEVIGISTAGIDSGQNINLAMGYECINMFIRGFI